MLQKNWSKKTKKILIVFLLFQQSFQLELGIYLGSHIRQNQNGQLESFNETISKNGKLMNLDIYITQDSENQEKTIQYLNAVNFDTTKQMFMVICPQNIDLSKIKKVQQLTSKGCQIDQKSPMYFDIDQENFVSYQKSLNGQRYSYGGFKYALGQIASEMSQYTNRQFRIKNALKNQLAKLAIEQTMEDKLKELIQDIAFLDIIVNYQLLEQISLNQREELFCNFDVNFNQIDSFDFKTLTDSNVIIAKTNENIQQNQQLIKPSEKQIDRKIFVSKFLEQFGLFLDYNIFEFQNNESQNFYIQFRFNSNQLSAYINNTNKGAFLKEDLEGFNMANAMNKLSGLIKKNGYFQLSDLKTNPIEIQIMACSGLYLPNPKENLLNELDLMGCDKIKTINGIFQGNNNKKQDQVIEKIKFYQHNFVIENFQMQSIKRKSQEEDKIQISGFLEQCDILYDTLLSALFVLCYLTYSIEGKFQLPGQLIDKTQQQRVLMTETLSITHLKTPKLEEFKFEEKNKRALNKNRILLMNEKYEKGMQKRYSKEGLDDLKDCCECMCYCIMCVVDVLYCILIMFYLVILCICLIGKCMSGCKSRILLGNNISEQNILIQGYQQYSQLIRQISNGQKFTYYQFLASATQNAEQFIDSAFTYIPDEIPDTIQIDNETIYLEKETKKALKIEQNAELVIDNMDEKLKKRIVLI